jgi:hypothetical protein
MNKNCDQLLLRLAPTTNEYPVTPLDLRLSPVIIGEPLYVVTYARDDQGLTQQVVHKVRRAPTLDFTCLLENPTELNGFSGAPIVDQHGLLVGILTGGSDLDINNATGYMRAIRGHLARELMPLLKEEVAAKGFATLKPINPVNPSPVHAGNLFPAKPPRGAI